MSLDARLTAAAQHVAGGVVAPEIDLDVVRARARSNRRRTTTLGVAASVVAVVLVAAMAVGGQKTAVHEPDPAATSPAPSPTTQSAAPFRPESMTPQVVVGTASAQLQLVGIASERTDIRMSVWKVAGYTGMALTRDGYRTTTYAAFPEGATQVVGSPKNGVFLLSDGSDKEWLVDVDGTVRRVTRVSSTLTPTDPRLWFQCVYGDWRARWCSLDLATATAHLSSKEWGGSAVRPGLGAEPWGVHPDPRAASQTGVLEAWWYSAGGRQVRTVAQAHDGDYVLGTPPGQMAFWAPGSKAGTVDIHTARSGGTGWAATTYATPVVGTSGVGRVVRAADGALLLCTSGDALVVARAAPGSRSFEQVLEVPASGDQPCSGLGTQGGSAYLVTGDVAAVSQDAGRTWTTVETWR